MKKLYLFIIFLVVLTPAYNQIIKCGDAHTKHYLQTKYPGIENFFASNYKWPENGRTTETLRIPVVVHLIYNNSSELLAEDIVRNQIEVLNQDYNRFNADASETREIFQEIAGKANVEFFLATKDPDGNATNGITKHFTEKTSFLDFDYALFLQAIITCGVDLNDPQSIADNLDCIISIYGSDPTQIDFIAQLDEVKSSDTGGVDPWDQSRYLNIWVCNLSVSVFGEQVPFLLGYAYPPVGAPNWPTEEFPEDYWTKDGVVIHYQVFGKDNPAIGSLQGINDQGRTLTHEVGHYLGLRHIWGDGDCGLDDGIGDTPLMANESQDQSGSIIQCSSLFNKNTCVDEGTDYPDMIENYMDYTQESCQNMFSVEQVALMRNMLMGPRLELVEAGASSTDDVSKIKHITLLPNPATTEIVVPSFTSFKLIVAYDINGKFQKSWINPERKIEITELTKVINILHLTDVKGNLYTARMIKM